MRRRAIIIDDDTAIQVLLKSVLETRGFDVITCSSPIICSDLLHTGCHCPDDHVCADIIMIDINLPTIDGLEFVTQQKQRGCKVKNFAVMSGMWNNDQLERAKHMGCAVMKKPFEVSKVLHWIEECEKRIDHKRKLWDMPIPPDNL